MDTTTSKLVERQIAKEFAELEGEEKQLEDMPCLIVTGKAGSGKDTFAKAVNEYLFGTNHSRLEPIRFSEPLKRFCCDLFGWDLGRIGHQDYKEKPLGDAPRLNGKTFQTRRAVLQHIGTDIMRAANPDIWVNTEILRIRRIPNLNPIDGFISTDCRFDNEVLNLQRVFKNNMVVEVKRSDPSITSGCKPHESENGLSPRFIDMSFQSPEGDLTRLRNFAAAVSKELFNEL